MGDRMKNSGGRKTRLISSQDCPVVYKSDRITGLTITKDKDKNAAIIEKHGSPEAYLFNKVLHQFNEIAYYEHKAVKYKNENIILRSQLASANAIIEAYEEMYC